MRWLSVSGQRPLAGRYPLPTGDLALIYGAFFQNKIAARISVCGLPEPTNLACDARPYQWPEASGCTRIVVYKRHAEMSAQERLEYLADGARC